MKKRENGQALVLVLLSLSVVLTMVLYILSRSVTDIAVSGNQEEAVRAFSAAEAGIERALVVGSGNSSQIGDSSYVANVSGTAQGLTGFAYPIALFSGDSATFWLAAHNASGIPDPTVAGSFSGNKIKICWGDVATAPAIEVTVYYETTSGNLSTIQVNRWAYDANAGRAVGNHFTSAVATGSCTISGHNYAFQETLTLPSYSILAMVKLFYNDTPQNVGVDVSVSTTGGNRTLPSQGQDITSTGTAGGSNRKIAVFQGWPEFPFVSNAVFSPDAITK